MMNMNKKECSQLYLPEELWAIIFKKLKSPLDVVRFRSTCSLWHSFLPPPTLSFNLCIPHQEYFLEQTKIYRIQPSPSTSCSNNKGWLIKVFQSTHSSKFYLLDLFTNNKLPSGKIAQKVNLMNVRVVELFELYTPCQRYENNFGFAPDSFEDIILYKGQVYVVDKIGTIFWINTLSLKLVQFSPKNSSYGEERQPMNFDKRLVEYDGNLYVVDLYIDGHDEKYCKLSYLLKGVFVKVYKLDQEWGKWLDVKDLGDVSFVLGKDSNFALLAQDYHGCERNCIYFFYQGMASCFSLENLEFKVANKFWPCPTLFHSVTS